MEIFELTNIIFNNKEMYKNVSNLDKSKNFFMLNRMFARKYPEQANVLQHLKINSIQVVDFWQQFLSKQYDKIPYWMFIKGLKKTQEVKQEKKNISNEIINEYCKIYNVDKKSVLTALEYFNQNMVNELKDFEKILKQK